MLSRIVFASLLAFLAAGGARAQQPTEQGIAAPPAPHVPGTSSAGELRLTAPTGGSSTAPSPPRAAPAVPRDGRGNPIVPARPTKDPTVPDPAMRDLIERGTTQPSGQPTPPPQPGVPEIRIRARVFARDKPPIAVLEVGGRPLTVRKDSEIHIPATADQPTGVQLKVVELSPTELRLEVLKRNQIISLN